MKIIIKNKLIEFMTSAFYFFIGSCLYYPSLKFFQLTENIPAIYINYIWLIPSTIIFGFITIAGIFMQLFALLLFSIFLFKWDEEEYIKDSFIMEILK